MRFLNKIKLWLARYWRRFLCRRNFHELELMCSMFRLGGVSYYYCRCIHCDKRVGMTGEGMNWDFNTKMVRGFRDDLSKEE